MRIKKRILQKIFSSFSALILLVNSVVPYIPVPVAYSTEPLQTNISFSNNSFQISANTSEALTYLLAYKTPENIEGANATKIEKSDDNFSKEIYAGIKSGSDSRQDEVIRGIYKLESGDSFNEKRFTFEDGSLKIVDETTAGTITLTDADSNWLETGTDTIEQTCDTETIDNNTYIDWDTNLDEKTSKTKEKVKVGVTYIFPLENKVTVKFSCLPKNEALRTTLKIQQVKVADLNLPDSVNPATDYAYDITTGMRDGSFKYEVTLPKVENQEAEVSYIEKTVEEATTQEITIEEVKPVDETKTTQEENKVKVIDLDHFTIYFVISPLVPATLNGSTHVEVAPNETITVDLNVNTDDYRWSNNNWKSTAWKIGNGTWQCTYNPNYSDSGLHSYSFNINAPLQPGNYNVFFRAYNSNNCTSGWNNNYSETTLTNGITVVVLEPDLIATKNHTPSGDVTVNSTFIWNIHIANSGTGTATFSNGETILTDYLPDSNVAYGAPSVSNKTEVNGNIDCSISSNILTCTASGSVTINTSGSFDVSWNTTPTATGSLKNPKDAWWDWETWSWKGGVCKVDPNNNESESNDNNNSCSETINIAQYIATNPPFAQSCGLDVALVLDNSGSVGSNLGTMKTAFKSFVDSLSGTPTQYSVTYFNDTAHLEQVFTNSSSTAKTAIDNVPTAGGSTNWQDGLLKAKLSFDPRPTVPNLIIFSSDGDPNRYYTNISNENNPTGLAGPGNNYDETSHNATISLANIIKENKTRIITLGIGGGSSMQTHMEAISSSDAYYNASNFDDLSTTLNEIVTDLCGGTITVTKLVDGVDTPGWDYSVSVTDGTPNPTNGTTDSSGKVNFDINPTDGGSANASVVETIKSGYQIVSASCSTPTNSVGTFDGVDSVDGITVRNSDVISCTFNNLKATGKIELQKHWVGPAGNAYFNIGSSEQASDIASEFISGSDGTSGEKIVQAGNYYVSETLPLTNPYTSSLACYNDLNDNDAIDDGDTTHDVNITTGEVAVGANEDVICIFTNTHNKGSIFGTKYEDLNSSGSRDEVEGSQNTEPGLPGWTIDLYDAAGAKINTYISNSKGDYEFLNIPTGNYKVCEVLQTGWINTDPGNSEVCKDLVVTKDQTTNANFGNKRNPVTIKATKIVCPDESDLPNWSGSSNINQSKIDNFLASHQQCNLESGWDFQWGFADKTGTQGVDKLNGTHVGLADGTDSTGLCSAPYCGPNTQTGTAYNQWKTFGPTDTNGVTSVEITDLEGTPGIWVRESLKQNYVPFSYPPQASPGSNVSAEIYCHTDVANYDNYDQISSPQYGQTYYCVAFNALNSTHINGQKFNDLDGNGAKNGEEPGLPGWTIYAAQEVESLDIAALDTPIVSSSTLENGETYLIRASNTYYANDGITADAKYSQRNPNMIWTDVVQHYESYGPTLLDLQVNGASPDWGSYNLTHVYWLAYAGTGAPIDFRIYDLKNGSNNSGSLNVKIYKVLTKTTTDGDGNYSLSIDGALTGSVIVAEQTQSGWAQTAPTGADFGYCTVTPFVQNTCDFGNRASTAKISVDKVTVPSGSSEKFSFEVIEDDQTIDSFTLTDTQTPHFTEVAAGTYSIRENSNPKGWVGLSAFCIINGDKNNPVTSLESITLNPDDEALCEFKNAKNPQVTVNKFEDLNANGTKDSGENNLKGWMINVYDQDNCDGTPIEYNPTDSSGNVTFADFGPGTYSFAEVYDPTVWTPTTGENCKTVTITNWGEQQTIYFGNTQYGKVVVTKYHDNNLKNGVKDSGELVLQGWEINLDDQIATTSTDGTAIFDNLLAGTYKLSEKNKKGWRQTSIYCDGEKTKDSDNTHTITVKPGETTNCYIGNYHIPRLRITKKNNLWPYNGSIGGQVTFTVQITSEEDGNDVNNVHLVDLLPNGFTFNSGSATKDGSPMSTQPVYHSPGDWNVGTVNEGETVELAYTATISSDQEPGLYKDLAYAYGCETAETCSVTGSTSVLATAGTEGKITDNYVGTQVNLAKEQQDTGTISVEKEESQEGEVLGASTSLPSTGGKTVWMIISLLLLVFGIAAVAFGIAMKLGKIKFLNKILVLVFILLGILFFGKNDVSAQIANPLTIRLEQPQSPTRLTNFKLIFTTMDMLGRDITVKCFSDDVQFGGDIEVTPGGNTGYCQINSSVMSTNNHSYAFKVIAYAGTDTASDSVIVNYSTDGPDTPSEYGKDHPSDCRYKIHFKTANDNGKTVKVEIYRSKETSFGLDASNRAAVIDIGSNTEHTETDNLASECDKKWYYALRAYDIYGNASDWIGDSEITVTTTTTTTTTTSTTTGQTHTTGAIPVVNVTLSSAEVLGEKTTAGTEKKAKDQKEEKVNILGTTTKRTNKNLYIEGGIGLLVLAIIGYGIYKKKNSKLKTQS